MNLVILSGSGDYGKSGDLCDYDESGDSDESAQFWCIR